MLGGFVCVCVCTGVCVSVGWWCSNLYTYGKSLSFSADGGEGKMNFPNVLFYMRNLTFFPSTLTAFLVGVLWVGRVGRMIVILVSGSQLKESLSCCHDHHRRGEDYWHSESFLLAAKCILNSGEFALVLNTVQIVVNPKVIVVNIASTQTHRSYPLGTKYLLWNFSLFHDRH